MSATFNCNGCKAQITENDASYTRRITDKAAVYVEVGAYDPNGMRRGAFHLCIPCICKVLTDGKAPPETDEIPF